MGDALLIHLAGLGSAMAGGKAGPISRDSTWLIRRSGSKIFLQPVTQLFPGKSWRSSLATDFASALIVNSA